MANDIVLKSGCPKASATRDDRFTRGRRRIWQVPSVGGKSQQVRDRQILHEERVWG